MPTIYTTKRTRQRRHKDGSPAPQPHCEMCQKTIEVGMPHRNVSTYIGSPVRVRCMDCPTWQPWDLSSSLSARLQQVSYDFNQALDSAESQDDVVSALSTAAEAVREIAEEKRESSQNIEDGFGHPTEQSDELAQVADDLESWADEIEGVDVPDFPEPLDEDCEDCGASGFETTLEGATVGTCITCEGNGQVTPEEPTEEQIEEWRDEVREACSIVEESPV